MAICIKNPHSALAALATRPKDVLEASFHFSQNQAQGPWEQVRQLAIKNRVQIGQGSGKRPSSGHRESGTELKVKERTPLVVEELFSSSGKLESGLWLALDQLTDPQNVGAIFRSAAFFGVKGIILTQDRSASLTSTVYDVASGGMEYVPFAVETSLQRSFEIAKKAGLWILGSSEHANDDISTIQADRPWLLVLGNEEKGMRRLTEEACDVLCKIPSQGQVGSLNVSVAAGIMISQLTRK